MIGHGSVESKITETAVRHYSTTAQLNQSPSLLSLLLIIDQVSDYFYNYYLITTKVLLYVRISLLYLIINQVQSSKFD